MSRFEAQLSAELGSLEERGLLRTPTALSPGTLVLCSNDYLGYASDPLPDTIDEVASGAGGSRLISGDHALHARAEASLAEWLGYDGALLMSSGYAANVGVLSALAGEGDVIVSDAHNHASIIDGCRLSRARVVVVPHLDVGAMADALSDASGARMRWLVTESYFSMDGDTADLRALREICHELDAQLIVDEAHALGVFGSAGRGLCHDAGVRADVLIGTMGKALGLAGAFVAGSSALRSFLWNSARSFVFSTAVTPWLAAAAIDRVERVRRDDAARERLAAIVGEVRHELASFGAPIAPSIGPIVPWMVGEDARVVALRDRLLARGLFCQAIRPPTVPPDTARLRITLHARLRDEEVASAIAALRACL